MFIVRDIYCLVIQVDWMKWNEIGKKWYNHILKYDEDLILFLRFGISTFT